MGGLREAFSNSHVGSLAVIPAKAGIHFAFPLSNKIKKDPGFRRDDGLGADVRR